MKNNRIIKNYLYNLILTIFNIGFPLIVAPLISKRLGVERLGRVNFLMSTYQFAIVFASFGISVYGIREISKARESKEKLNKVFSEIFILNTITSIGTAVLYVIICSQFDKITSERSLYYAVILGVVLNLFSIEWLYIGLEKFKYITFRNIIMKLLTLLFIFYFIDSEDRYSFYGFVLIGNFVISNILNFVFSFKYIKITFANLKMIKHVKKTKYFFMSLFFSSIYGIFDQIILGVKSNLTAVALYSRSKLVLSVAISITTVLSKTLSPSLSKMYSDKDKNFNLLLKSSINYLYMLSIPIAIGVFLLSNEIMYILGGNEFLEGSIILKVLSFWIIVVSLAVFIDNQMAIPLGLEKNTVKATLIVALINLVLNMILIPKYSFVGTAISLIVSELFGLSIQIYLIKKSYNFKFVDKNLFKNILAGSTMFLVGKIIKGKLVMNILNLSIVITVSAIFYFFVLFFLKDDCVYSSLIKIRKGKNE